MTAQRQQTRIEGGGCDRKALADELKTHSETCIECKLCIKGCQFLQKYGTPKRIADSYDPASPDGRRMPFECSLCRSCAAVCPLKLNPAAMFLEMRREAVGRGGGEFRQHSVILNYERRGASKRYSYYGLPAGCDTVLFPGCALPGTRPDKVMRLYEHLRQSCSRLGIVLDCCAKPSHDLGRDSRFHALFNEMKGYLLRHGIKTILVACPNCYRVFKQYGGELAVKTVYEALAETGLPATANIPGRVTIHDPCGARFDEHIHKAVRGLAAAKSLQIEEMKRAGANTICCGEGGSAGCLSPFFAKSWSARRKEEAKGTRILTYCAGCANFLNPITPTSHILDLLFDPQATLAGTVKVSRSPWTYLNRILLKKKFKKKVAAAISRERTFTGKL